MHLQRYHAVRRGDRRPRAHEPVFEQPWFGYENARAMGGLVRRGLIASADYENFMAAQVALHASGGYFYSITGYAYAGRRRAF